MRGGSACPFEEKMNTFFGTLADFLSEESFSELSNLRGETRDFSKKSLMGGLFLRKRSGGSEGSGLAL